MAQQKRFILDEKDIPTQWYNIQADMPTKPLPPIHPATRKPMTAEDLSEIFRNVQNKNLIVSMLGLIFPKKCWRCISIIAPHLLSVRMLWRKH